MLWSQIIYGHRTATISQQNRTILRHPYGARPAEGRTIRFWIKQIRHRTVPVRYVTTQEKTLKNRPVPGRLSNVSVLFVIIALPARNKKYAKKLHIFVSLSGVIHCI